MENNNEYVKKISDKLDNIITKGFEINRNNILEAEDIKYNKSTINSETYDEFGFLDKYKDKNEINFHKALTEDEELKIDAQQNLRILKWTEMLENYDKYKLSNFSKLKERTRKGIPDSMRGIAWINLAGKRRRCYYTRFTQNISKKYNFFCKIRGGTKKFIQNFNVCRGNQSNNRVRAGDGVSRRIVFILYG